MVLEEELSDARGTAVVGKFLAKEERAKRP